MNIRSRHFPALLASTCLLALAACSDERPGSNVSGDRRAPVLNQQMMQEVSAKNKEKPSEKTIPTDSPFDRYDASGNPTPYGKPTSHMDPPPPAKEKGLLDGIFGSSRPHKSEAKEIRKPISGNPYYSKDTEAIAPLAGAPEVRSVDAASETPDSVSMVTGPTPTGAKGKYRVVDKGPHLLQLPVSTQEPAPQLHVPVTAKQTENALPPYQPEPSMAKPQPLPEPIEASKQLPPPSESPKKEPSFFSGLLGSDEESQGASEALAGKNTDYVPLNSVPQKPARFEEIKRESADAMSQMQDEHAAAQVQKEALAEEQSDLADQQINPQVPTVNSMGQPVVAAPANAQPAGMQLAPLIATQPVVLEGEKNQKGHENLVEAPPLAVMPTAPAMAPAAVSPSALPSPTILQQKKAVLSAH